MVTSHGGGRIEEVFVSVDPARHRSRQPAFPRASLQFRPSHRRERRLSQSAHFTQGARPLPCIATWMVTSAKETMTERS